MICRLFPQFPLRTESEVDVRNVVIRRDISVPTVLLLSATALTAIAEYPGECSISLLRWTLGLKSGVLVSRIAVAQGLRLPTILDAVYLTA